MMRRLLAATLNIVILLLAAGCSGGEDGLTLLVGTYTDSGAVGIYSYSFDQKTGESAPLAVTEVANPSFLDVTPDRSRVYAVSESQAGAEVSSFGFDPAKGTLTLINKRPALGKDPCHVTFLGNEVVTSNYSSGSMTVFPVEADGGLGEGSVLEFFESGPVAGRQAGSHIHSSQVTPDGKYLLVIDLGGDYIYRFPVSDGKLASLEPVKFKAPEGSGPRHFDFSKDGRFMYVITELGGTVAVYEYNDGDLVQIQEIEADPLHASGSADIHFSPDGRFLYASNRLKGDGLAIFSQDPDSGLLTYAGYQSTGSHPRNFAITPNGRHVLVACRDSDSIQVFERDPKTGLLRDTGKAISLPHPVCVKLVSNEPLSNLESLVIHNPIIPGYHPDPSICRVGEDYYIVNSSFQYFPGVPIYHSKDLANWELIGNVLDRESQIPLERANSWGGIFATTIRYHEGLYYMVTTNVTKGGNFFVTAKDPAGPWSEPVYLKQGGIDPSFLFEDGKCYMVSNPDGIQLCEIDPVTGEQLTESKLLWRGTGGRYPEGPHIYKKDGWYYLLISEGGTEMGHNLTIARSRNIYGPYESNPDNPILSHFRRVAQDNQIQATGHGDLVEAPDGSWWITFLAFRRFGGDFHHLGRETFLAPVTWENGWPVVNGGEPVQEEMTVPASWTAKAPTSRSFREEFEEPLGAKWIYVQNPDSTRYSVAGGVLTLRGNTPLEDNDHPVFVGVRQESPAVSVETKVRLNTPSGEAGVAVYQHGDGFISVGVSKGKASLRLKLKAVDTILGETSVKGPETIIRVESKDGNMYEFFADGKLLGEVNTSLMSSEVVGGFTGVVFGLYAAGGTAGFEYFDYQEK
ncbi:MAG: beta-propeller fold lactonase family protein [Bacteroidales bacterium]|nr:beta-propeller fold lactonase family protein [Bacteroidales bacterium]